MSYVNNEVASNNKLFALPKRQRTKVLSVTSGKGGVGKTTTSINLALALNQNGFKVLLLDADLGLANINVMLGFQSKFTIDDVLANKARIEDVIVNHSSGIDVIPAGSGIYDVTHLDDEKKQVLLASIQVLNDSYDYLIIDTSAGIGSNVLYFNSAAERVLVVVDPEPTSITDAYALIKVMQNKSGITEFDIVINRAQIGTDGRDVFKRLLQVTNRFLDVRLNFTGVIQEDDSVTEAIMKQMPLLSLYPSTRASRDYLRLAKKIENSSADFRPKGGLQFFFESLVS
jgi:flagellar biosynthesis protein FlhG